MPAQERHVCSYTRLPHRNELGFWWTVSPINHCFGGNAPLAAAAQATSCEHENKAQLPSSSIHKCSLSLPNHLLRPDFTNPVFSR